MDRAVDSEVPAAPATVRNPRPAGPGRTAMTEVTALPSTTRHDTDEDFGRDRDPLQDRGHSPVFFRKSRGMRVPMRP